MTELQSVVNIANPTLSEQALRDSEARYRRLFETAQDGVLILDAKTGLITDVNPASKVLEAQATADLAHFRRRQATAEAGTHDCSGAGSRDRRNRNLRFLQNLKHTNVNHAAGEASAPANSRAAELLEYLEVTHLRSWPRKTRMRI